MLTKNLHRKIKITFALLARFSCASDMFGVWIARCSDAFFEWNAQVGAENRTSACQAVVLESVKLPRVRTVRSVVYHNEVPLTLLSSCLSIEQLLHLDIL